MPKGRLAVKKEHRNKKLKQSGLVCKRNVIYLFGESVFLAKENKPFQNLISPGSISTNTFIRNCTKKLGHFKVIINLQVMLVKWTSFKIQNGWGKGSREQNEI
jgi:hypothetical protein